MSFRAILSALLIGFILFIVVVALGMKFNWVSYFSPSAPDNAVHSSRIESESVQNIPSAQQAQVSNYQLINENSHLSITDESVRDQCIRSSRQAGVTDAHIHEAVRQCVELTQRKRDQARPEEKSKQTDNMDMTREACKIVASEEKGLSHDEQQAMILQCIQANSN